MLIAEMVGQLDLECPPRPSGSVMPTQILGHSLIVLRGSSSFIPAAGGPPPAVLWQCQYPVPPNPGGPLSALQDACASDSGGEPSHVTFTERGGEATATCMT
jgi:hypothetical protein